MRATRPQTRRSARPVCTTAAAPTVPALPEPPADPQAGHQAGQRLGKNGPQRTASVPLILGGGQKAGKAIKNKDEELDWRCGGAASAGEVSDDDEACTAPCRRRAGAGVPAGPPAQGQRAEG